jgi:hypothetical protein
MTPNAIFEMDFDMRLKQRLIQTSWKDSNNFKKTERNLNIGDD